MRSHEILTWIMGASLLCVVPLSGQASRPMNDRADSRARNLEGEPGIPTVPSVPSREAQAAAPRLLKFSGVLPELLPSPSGGPAEMTLSLYKEELGGDPLWTEVQNVEVDKQGRYTILLGATQAEGLPIELFPSGEARWLSVEIQGQPQQPRVLLVGVPYALKAADAEKLGGKSLSDFVLSESLRDQVRRVMQADNGSANATTPPGNETLKQTKANNTPSPQVTSAGPMFPPSTFSGTNASQIVSVQQKGAGSGLVAATPSSTGASALVGLATSTSTSNSVFQNGVYGQNDGAGAGVAGVATNPSVGVGVYGQSANFAGVFGNSPATSGFANGVYGQTGSPDGAGISGNNTAVLGFANGVYGQSVSTTGSGVFGHNIATSGFANGVYGQTASGDGTGVGGNNTALSGFANGVSGQSASTNGAGVFGNAVATSGFTQGVVGQNASTSGAGVVGYAYGTSGFANGVFGQSASTSGTGVTGYAPSTGIFGNATATSGFTSGVSGDATSSPNGSGVFGRTVQWIGVGGQATATSGTPAYGVWGDTASTSGVGVVGFADAPSGYSYGVAGNNASINGLAVFGNATAGSGSPSGVYGITISPDGNGVVGNAASTSGFPTAVVGFLNSNDGGIAGQFVAHGGKGLILQGVSGPNFNQVFSVGANGDLNIAGNLTVGGTKSSTAKLQNGREILLYAVESPENWFEDFGSAELENGSAWVPLDTSFAEATNTAITYHVFLTPNGDSNGLYVARKTAAGFEVREQGGGGSSVPFDFRIVVRRRGYETVRMAEVHGDVNTLEASRQHLAQLANSGNLKKVDVVKAPQIVAPPTIRPVPPRPSIANAPKPNIPPLPKASVPQPGKTR